MCKYSYTWLEDFILLGLVCVRGVRSCIASCSLNTYYIYAGVHSFALVCVCSLRCARCGCRRRAAPLRACNKRIKGQSAECVAQSGRARSANTFLAAGFKQNWQNWIKLRVVLAIAKLALQIQMRVLITAGSNYSSAVWIMRSGMKLWIPKKNHLCKWIFV